MSTNVAPFSQLVLGTNNADGTFTGVTTGSSAPIRLRDHQALKVVAIGDGTITGGTVLIEVAYMGDAKHYNGTWSTLLTITAADVTSTGQKAFYILGPINTVDPVRARISSDITGGGHISIALEAQ